MTPTIEMMDELASSANAARQRRRRILLPIGLVLLVMALLAAIALFNYRANRTDALKLSEDVIESLQQRIETEVEAYLAPVSELVMLSRDLLNENRLEAIPRDLAEPLALRILRHHPEITIFSLGLENGEYLMVRRDRDPAGFSTKFIEYGNGLPDMSWTRRDDDMAVIAREQVPWDAFDPRKRPWYRGATGVRGLFWTDVYVFFTDRTPGITVSAPLLDEAGELIGVVGLDLTLETLGQFLADLQIGHSGRALIINGAGQVIASPDARIATVQDGDSLELTRVEDLGDPVLNRAFDRFRVEGYGHRLISLDGRRHIGAASPLQHLLQQDWSVLIVVPENDFVGFVRENVRKTAFMALGLIALASLLAALLIRQGLRADRNASLVLSRQAELERQSDAFATLAGQAALFEPNDQSALGLLTETVCQAAGVQRASLWELSACGQRLRCIDCYDENSGGHTKGMLLVRDDHLLLFETLTAGVAFAVTDAPKDPRLEGLHRIYLDPLGCRALLSGPIRSHERTVGALWLEAGADRGPWGKQIQAFAQAVANLLAVRYSATAQEAPDAAPDVPSDGMRRSLAPAAVQPQSSGLSTASDCTLGPRRTAAFVERLAARAGEHGTSKARIIDALAVMALRFTDETALAMDAAESRPAVDFLVDKLERLAADHDIPYLKFMSDQVVAAAGIDSDPALGVMHTAEYALAIQNLCRHFFAQRHSKLLFSIGLDHGPAIGSVIGVDKQSYNLWGEAVRMATIMADTSLRGSIQTTESVYSLLRDHYLFQVRGTYYLEGVGELTTYTMSGRL